MLLIQSTIKSWPWSWSLKLIDNPHNKIAIEYGALQCLFQYITRKYYVFQVSFKQNIFHNYKLWTVSSFVPPFFSFICFVFCMIGIKLKPLTPVSVVRCFRIFIKGWYKQICKYKSLHELILMKFSENKYLLAYVFFFFCTFR